MTYKLNHAEYLRILSHCTSAHQYHAFGGTQQLLMDLLQCNVMSIDDTIEIPEKLMRRVAILNLCDMAYIQHRDSGGEIDYTGLGEYSFDVINNILRLIAGGAL